jgi:hypothetical protein
LEWTGAARLFAFKKGGVMSLFQRARLLRSLFRVDRGVSLEDSPVEIRSCLFVCRRRREAGCAREGALPGDFSPVADRQVAENRRFSYAVFLPRGAARSRGAILLLHGLNERDWDKYLPWAERLVLLTGKAVVLFPIAFHMNRAPAAWRDPRLSLALAGARRSMGRNATFANATISARLSACPWRFHLSGKETLFDLRQLLGEIREGRHPLFVAGARVDMFAYSIGALLAEVLLLSDRGGLTGDARLFMFCGGALFSYMNGEARDIVDGEAYARVRSFYLDEFLGRGDGGAFERAFRSMIVDGVGRERREVFFEGARERVRAVTLSNDAVMPTPGARAAFGERLSGAMLEEMTFPFVCSHQHPFPPGEGAAGELVEAAFDGLFDRAAGLLA